MKKLTLLIATVIFCQILHSQHCTSQFSTCTPAGVIATGFYPPSDSLQPLLTGATATSVIQFKNLDTARYMGSLITVIRLRVDSINNLPSGLCWAMDHSNNIFANQEEGCINIFGTTNAPIGQYKLSIKVGVDIDLPTNPFIPANAADFGLNYYVRLINPGMNTPCIDTAGAPSFLSYTGAEPACPVFQSYSVNLGADQTVCTGSRVILNPIVTGGAQPLTYNWSSTGDNPSCNTCRYPSVTTTQNSRYVVTVIDALQFTVTDTINFNATAGSNQMQVSTTNTLIDCTNLVDTTTATVINGIAPYIFNWGNLATDTGNSPRTHLFTQSGEHVIRITDAAGCVTTILDTVPYQGIVISSLQEVHPFCQSMSTGKIFALASGGTSPYSFLWSNNSTSDSITSVVARHYYLRVTDATSCSTTAEFNLYPLSHWDYYVYLTNTVANCNNNGTLSSTVTGGVSPFSYLWSNGSTIQNLSQLSGGSYSLTVTDSLGCQTEGNAMIYSHCESLISGVIFIDSNANCIHDIGEAPRPYISVVVTGNGDSYYGTTHSNGMYSISVPTPGAYSLAAYSYNNFGSCGNLSLCGNPTQTVIVAAAGDSSPNNNFGYNASLGYDLNLFVRWSASNPGFQKNYRISAYNHSQIPLNGSATLTFAYDSNLIFQTSNLPVTHNLSDHTLTWTLDSINNSFAFFWSNEILATFFVPINLSLNYMLQNDFRIDPTIGDCDSSNNHFHTSDVVTGSYDPNEKIVEPAGKILETDSILTYTIGFQNTGTDSTHFIILKDTLSANLDPVTVRNVASSHPFSDFSISGKGILTWTFNPLRLVDSFTNEPGSHGFVKFTVKKKLNLPVGSTIRNGASIYFDYNEPVATNIVADTISSPDFVFETNGDYGISINAFPNPFNDATTILINGVDGKFDFNLFDITGSLRKRFALIDTPKFELQRDELSSGIYFFSITTSKGNNAYGKLVAE